MLSKNKLFFESARIETTHLLGHESSPFFEELQFQALPSRVDDTMTLAAPMNPEHGMQIDPDYFFYEGSLTQPPCTDEIAQFWSQH
jgi:hypothetical protein